MHLCTYALMHLCSAICSAMQCGSIRTKFNSRRSLWRAHWWLEASSVALVFYISPLYCNFYMISTVLSVLVFYMISTVLQLLHL